jgi:adenylylsulfate kinase-like enzyme
MKILVMGLSGSGKTTFAKKLAKDLDAVLFNADEIRNLTKFSDFSSNGRIIQAKRMKLYADYECKLGKTVICDFICPTIETREIFKADIIIWMDTTQVSRYQDTNALFEKPSDYDFVIGEFSETIYENILKKIRANT